MLVTEKKGTLHLVGQDGQSFGSIGGTPDVDYGGHSGLGDVALHPDFENNALVYLSYVESGPGGTRGAAVTRGSPAQVDAEASLSSGQRSELS
jgi:glucose/arabinose dehydrogenase